MDRPHSRQHLLRRGVISPQNGHIRCGPKSKPSGLRFARKWANQSAMEVSLLHKRLRNRRTFISIGLPWSSQQRRHTARAVGRFPCNCRVPELALQFCAGLLTLTAFAGDPGRIELRNEANLSNSDQLFFPNKPIIKVETSTPSLSFRSSELSQLI
jgi:hypothetical protein